MPLGLWKEGPTSVSNLDGNWLSLCVNLYSCFVKSRSGLPLFKSPEQERLLAELFVFAQEPLSLSQLAQRTGTSMGGVHKEVERLEG